MVVTSFGHASGICVCVCVHVRVTYVRMLVTKMVRGVGASVARERASVRRAGCYCVDKEWSNTEIVKLTVESQPPASMQRRSTSDAT
jgi:hypothetical protein